MLPSLFRWYFVFIEFLWFLHMFIKLWKTSSSCPYVCLPFCLEQFGIHWMDFHDIWYLSIFKKSVEIQVSLKYAINKGTIHEDQYTFLILSHSVLLRMGNVSDISCGENQHTHILCSRNFYRKSCCLWDKAEKYCGASRP